MVIRIIVTFTFLVSSTLLAQSQISLSEKDLQSAQSVVNNMMKQASNEQSQQMAKQFQIEGAKAIEKGVSKQFNTSTLQAFGIERDTFSEAKNPHMIHNQLVMFVSSSMPKETLRAYARDLSKVGGIMAIRGAQGGVKDYLKTRQWMWEILKQDANCRGYSCATWRTEIVIDPVLFSMYDIKQVPALIYQPDMQIGSYCDDETKAIKTSAIVYGDAYLGRMIDSLIRQEPGNQRLVELGEML